MAVTSRLAAALFRASRELPVGPIVRLGFAHFSWLLPVRRVAETSGALAFHHPRPVRSPHVLVIAKRPIASLMRLRESDAGWLRELLELADRAAMVVKLRDGYSLEVNGGAFQDVAQMHFHLWSLPGDAADASRAVQWRAELSARERLGAVDEASLARLVAGVQQIVLARQLERAGFTLALRRCADGRLDARLMSGATR
jgi:histidine triad (HIT) family protein